MEPRAPDKRVKEIKSVEMKLKITPKVRAWFGYKVEENNSTIAEEAFTLFEKAMEADPPRIVFRHLMTPERSLYCAALGESFDDFASDDSEQVVWHAVEDKIKKLGFTLRNVAIEHRREVLGFPSDKGATNEEKQ